ncbi:zinc finger protein RFP-like isoform X2 [Rhineura floridana]|uniref:zinc finger protein RFP-like isoform X2 n=1 Tax=Rhineura floridana TaxID=261503 RepID=UPI002AC86E32|nr:zinc finger protein RFP-like isoform X2 [Rhineura floridana]
MDASDDPMRGFQKAAVCSICLEYFKDPVSIDCGHNFCLGCITQCCEKSKRHFCCPHCRRRACKRDFRPNRELASMIEIAKRFKLRAEQAAEGMGVCEGHQEPLKLFCEDDQTLICVVCDRSKEHRAHAVLPIQEAALDYKEQIQNQSQSLKQKREKLQELKQAGKRTTEENLERLDAERRKVAGEFELLHQFLEEIEQPLLAQLNELELELKNGQEEKDAKLSEAVCVLEDLINEMEEKCKQPDSEFLKNAKDILSRSNKRPLSLPLKMPPDLKEKLSVFAQKSISLAETLKRFKANVTLDLDTAGPYLILSDDGKSVRLGDTRQKRANSRDRFNVYPCVLGCEGFTSGKHSWVVEVVEEGCWAVGVARESVKRKEKLNFRPEKGVWALEHFGANHYRALTSPPTPLPQRKAYRRVQVFLDYEEGQVAFFDAENEDWIFTFPSNHFAGERVHPWLWVGLRSQLRLYP